MHEAALALQIGVVAIDVLPRRALPSVPGFGTVDPTMTTECAAASTGAPRLWGMLRSLHTSLWSMDHRRGCKGTAFDDMEIA